MENLTGILTSQAVSKVTPQERLENYYTIVMEILRQFFVYITGDKNNDR
jgi:hypothetical protein